MIGLKGSCETKRLSGQGVQLVREPVSKKLGKVFQMDAAQLSPHLGESVGGRGYR